MIFMQGKGGGGGTYIYKCMHIMEVKEGEWVRGRRESHQKNVLYKRGGSGEFEHGLPTFESVPSPF